MPRKCTVCEHEKVEEINRLLLKGVSLRNIAKQYSVSAASLHRHKESHLPAKLVKAQEAREIAKADTLLDQVAGLRDKALSILDKAEQAGDLRTALQGVREAKGCLELLARLQGELQEQATVNILINPQWLSLRTVILEALDRYPEARQAVARALREVESNVVGQ
jgi:lambda repressor-like predicted transcriptional regulator